MDIVCRPKRASQCLTRQEKASLWPPENVLPVALWRVTTIQCGCSKQVGPSYPGECIDTCTCISTVCTICV